LLATPRTAPRSVSFTFLGVPDGRLALRPSAFHSTALPPGAVFLLPVSTRGADVSVRAWVPSPLVDFQSVTLGTTHSPGRVVLHGRVPFPKATLSSLELDLLNGGPLRHNDGNDQL